ncbi:zinc finger family protein [Perilla frutescens var. hirtella]|uniref:Zinc finger family protein n=1 Tax=Perilla frutescens var. hirtella TaxID=608512 RepID=A0AAD4J1C2_PERFH|nr:zinc finger family protein [Perilla frutescens var. hirtella]
MGGKCPHRSVKKRRYSHKSARRTKFELMDILLSYKFLRVSYLSILPIFSVQVMIFLTAECSRDDAVYDELKKTEGGSKPLPLDEDLPGMGQYYCLHCDRYFANVAVRDDHFKTKRHRKRVKIMMGPAPHTQLDADLAAGMGMPDNGPKLMSM